MWSCSDDHACICNMHEVVGLSIQRLEKGEWGWKRNNHHAVLGKLFWWLKSADIVLYSRWVYRTLLDFCGRIFRGLQLTDRMGVQQALWDGMGCHWSPCSNRMRDKRDSSRRPLRERMSRGGVVIVNPVFGRRQAGVGELGYLQFLLRLLESLSVAYTHQWLV